MPITIGNKEYKLVAERLVKFWEDFPDHRISTDIRMNGDGALAYAEILDKEDRVLSSGHSYVDLKIDKGTEKAETCAVGRAMAFFHKDLMGSEIASADEIATMLGESVKYMALVREHWDSINMTKGYLVPVFGEHENQPNVSAARETMKELGDDVYRALWKAPSRGGCFTTHERTLMKVKPEDAL